MKVPLKNRHNVTSFIKDRKVAAFSSSSNFLTRKISKEIDGDLKIIIEQGPGNGVMTKILLKKLLPDGRLILIEQNQEFQKTLKFLKDSRITIFEGSVQDFDYSKFLKNNEKVDLVISSIPFSFLKKEERIIVCRDVAKHLKKNGKFIIFHQYSLLMENLLDEYFTNVKHQFILRNIFPCFVLYSSQK